MSYRDDVDALDARVDALCRELDRTTRLATEARRLASAPASLGTVGWDDHFCVRSVSSYFASLIGASIVVAAVVGAGKLASAMSPRDASLIDICCIEPGEIVRSPCSDSDDLFEPDRWWDQAAVSCELIYRRVHIANEETGLASLLSMSHELSR